MDALRVSGKPFEISKWEVQEAYQQVRANQGAPGVDGQSLAEFELDLKGNLYKIWNRMSSGTYFPPPVRAVELPKPDGGVRVLGVPTVADRIAQTVAARRLSEKVEPIFHPDSSGYRPKRSALDAVATCRTRCWKYDWVIDLDVSKFFDSVPWDLMIKAVEAHTEDAWVVLYVKRWLQAPLRLTDGSLQQRTKGTPQGSSISPVLANLFMHYAFDRWLAENFPSVPFERYADDAVVHCRTKRQACEVRAALAARMEQVGLQLHPAKTKIVYCKDGKRRGSSEHTAFTFLGFTFRARAALAKSGKLFTSFLPAISGVALKKLGEVVRGWHLHRRTNLAAGDIARMINPIVRGWMQYYGAFYRSALYPILWRINDCLLRYIRKKYKRARGYHKAKQVFEWNVRMRPRAFAHWAWTTACWQ